MADVTGDLAKFGLAGTDAGDAVLWCPPGRHCKVVFTLAEAIEWAENHADD
jgi:hypothetical protein